MHSSIGENSLFKYNVILESDAITTSVPLWIPTDNIGVLTPVRSDSGESDSPGSSYVPGSPLPSPGLDSDTYSENGMLFDVAEPRGLPPIPENEYFTGP